MKNIFGKVILSLAYLSLITACGDSNITLPAEDIVTQEAPVLVGTISLSNTSIIVTFSNEMNDEAANPLNYSIAQKSDNGRLLPVTAATFSGTNKKAVILTTLSQSEIAYKLMVVNAQDTLGQDFLVESTNTGFHTANNASFVGTAAVGGGIDTDGDGVSDATEQRGWEITIVDVNGKVKTVNVNSDPTLPDTDGDQLSDYDELQYGSNPRSTDTDGDGIDDNTELNLIYSSPFMSDTDGDGLEDGLELNSLLTSPIHADTDGDQLSDNDELFSRYRNPRVADLPSFLLIPGNHVITLNETYTYTDATGNEVIQESSSSTVLGTGLDTEILTIDETVNETLRNWGGDITIKGGWSEEGKGFFWGQANAYTDWNLNTITTSGTETSRVIESNLVLEESYNKGKMYTTSSEVTREVTGASLNVELSLRNKGDIAFTVTDIEVSMLRSRPGTPELEPIASLHPQANSSGVYHIGPFNPEVGPLIFTTDSLPVGLAEELMRNPSGIVFRVANYSVTDEFGRQFSYINQQVEDLTAGLVIDYGFEGVERYQMAASGMRDLTTNNLVGMFDTQGRPTGLPLTFLLETQLGWERNPTTKDAIIAGVEGIAQTAALGDDVQKVSIGTRGLGIGEVIILAGPNGIIDSTIDANSQNKEAITRGFDTSATCGTDSPVIFQGSKSCSIASDCNCTAINGCPAEIAAAAPVSNPNYDNAQCDGPQIITRVGGYANKAGSYKWVALTNADLSLSTDVDSIVMKPGEAFKLAFVQDLDKDGLFGRHEFMAGTTDSPVNQEDNVGFGDTYRVPLPAEANACPFQLIPEFCGDEALQSVLIPLADSRDTDRDGIEDAVELHLGWDVTANGQLRRKVYSSPLLRDSDGDGLTDWQERDIRFSCANQFFVAGENRQAEGDYNGPLRSGEFAFSENTIVAYPAGYENQKVLYDITFAAAASPLPGVVAAGDELVSELMEYADSNNDMYINKIAPYCQPDVLNPSTADPTDYISRAVGLDPQNTDTDGDGVSDGEELMGYEVTGAIVARVWFGRITEDPSNVSIIAHGDDILVRSFSVTIEPGDVILLPGANGQFDADYASLHVYDDSITNNPIAIMEARASQRVRSNPLKADTDDDLLSDGAERALGTNPIVSGDVGDLMDSDGDGVFDIDESRGMNIQVNGVIVAVRSNPASSDTDGDGLPDFVEYQVGSNPTLIDTDADGVSDYNEFSAAQFNQYAPYANRFSNFVLDATNSMKYGTALSERDTDNDGLSDGEEIIGFTLYTIQNGATIPLLISTNPLVTDTDGDGLSDQYEQITPIHLGSPDKMTNPLVADSDGDGVNDGREAGLGGASIGSDPLTPDRRVTVTIYEMSLYDSSEISADWDWAIYIQAPGVLPPGNIVSWDYQFYSDYNQSGEQCDVCVIGVNFNTPLPGNDYLTVRSQFSLLRFMAPKGSEYYGQPAPAISTVQTFDIYEGQSFSLNGTVLQYDGNQDFSCVAEFNKAITYEDVAFQSSSNGEIDLSQGSCTVKLRYSVTTLQ